MHAATDNRKPRFAFVEEGIERMFRDYPTLLGFTIDESGELALDCWPQGADSEELSKEIVQQLLELVDGRTEAAAWLFGRTFARVVH